MNLSSLLSNHFDDHIETASRTLDALGTPLEVAIEVCFQALTNGSKVLACGNGGSAADSQHFVAELVGRFERERLPLAAVTLSADTSIMTAVGNDYGFDQVFSRQVAALGMPGDILLAISTSGNSGNVLQAIQTAHEREMAVIALTGRDGGKIGQMLYETDVHLCVPHHRTMRIQEMHILLLHLICDGIDALLLGEPQ
ncbi:phosphoheptose isomerase [Orrella marina]|uniref:Phosphoheptose isomerase n=1 Tax=Orrella marina TaxID=2163011 RepID=A0A2R4XMH4_9BURK|nr:phosphoheptose isomerase [Orrella marina]AWB34998.1 phosphoheptose isomerase [Orrella marina]